METLHPLLVFMLHSTNQDFSLKAFLSLIIAMQVHLCTYFFRLNLVLWIALTYLSCARERGPSADTLFEKVKGSDAHIDFANNITTSDSLNLLNFEYIYNGGGVGVGDFNNDGLADLFFVGNMVASRLYINDGDFSFRDVTELSGIDLTGYSGADSKGWPFGVSVMDINADGLQDIYISMGGPTNEEIYPNKLYINQGNLHFTEQSQAYGLAVPGQSIQAVFFDYDRDGDLDMFQLTGGGFERSPNVPHPIRRDGSSRNTDRLYRNDFDSSAGHPVFTNVSREANILEEGFGLGVCLLDINSDGWMDIYVANDYLTSDLLYVNNGNGTFKESSAEYFSHTSHFAMGCDAGDINNDGLTDLITVDMLPDDHYNRSLMLGPNQYDKFYYSVNQGYACQYMRNTLQLNRGQGKFSEIGQLAGIYKTSWSWSVLFADLDNDQFQDIFITNGFGKNVTDLDFVKYRSNLKAGSAQEQVRILLDSLSLRPPIKTHNYAFRNNGGYSFTDESVRWGFTTDHFSNGAAYVDLDNDGDLDMVTNNINEEASVYRNKTNDREKVNRHFLQVKLSGPSANPSAVGSRVEIRYDHDKMQTRLQSLVRGFESSVHDILHFGLGAHEMIDTMKIVWPDGHETVLTSVKADRLIVVNYDETDRLMGRNATVLKSSGFPTSFFTTQPAEALNIHYRNKTNAFNDFSFERLLPKKYSQNGQGIAVGDVNGDGLEDFYVGGAYHQPGEIYLQQKNGQFSGKAISRRNVGCEDAGSLFFDCEGDGDLDLYVVSGGNEFTRAHQRYQDRLYKNDGKGNFLPDSLALPIMLSSGSCVIAGDYDRDNDLDLFIGGRVVPGAYPLQPDSYLLRNDAGKFSDVTDEVAPGLRKIGMVTCALWTDIDNDRLPDLMIAGEWMPVTVYRNQNKKFVNITQSTGLSKLHGWWQSLVAGDFDNDGDMDYVAGNWGVNNPYEVTQQTPMSIVYKDFDKNGSIDAIMSCYQGGESYPVASLDYMLEQLPSLRKKVPNYAQYAACTSDKLLSYLDRKGMSTLYCHTLESSLVKNEGGGKFSVHPLPVEAQLAPLFGMAAEDVNGDGFLDLVGVGNFYATDVVIGKYDALKGLTMLGDGKGDFKSLPLGRSGFVVDGDAKTLTRLETGKGSLMLVGLNADSLKVFKVNTQKWRRIIPDKGEEYAFLLLNNDNKRKIEFSFGNTYLSQSSRTAIIPPGVKGMEIFNGNGTLSRKIDL